MASKTLDFTSWYELQADSESDDEKRSPVRGYTYSHRSYSQYRSSDGSWYEPLQVTFDQSTGNRSGRESLIQQLLDEMDDANQKIDQYTGDKGQRTAFGPHASRSEEGMSLQEFPIDPSSRLGETDESGCDEAVSSAIAEVSKDFISGNLSTGPLVSGESDDSHISSDNDLLRRRGAAYARYPETAAGLSDSDWNPYITDTDTNTSPRAVAELRSAPSLSGVTDSKQGSLASSFNPPLCSTKTGSSASKISKSSLYSSESKGGTDNTMQLSDIREKTETSFQSLATFKPDASISPPQLTGSKLSEYSFGKRSLESYDISSDNASHEEAARNLRKCFERTSWPPSPGNEKSSSGNAALSRSQKTSESGVDSASMEEKFKMLGNIGGLPQYPPISQKQDCLPGSGYFAAEVQNALAGNNSKGLYSPAQRSKPAEDKQDTVHTDVKDLPASCSIESRSRRNMQPSGDSLGPEKSSSHRLSGESDNRSVTSSSIDTVTLSTSHSRKETSSGTQSYHEKLDMQVQKLLQETAFLTGSARAKDRERLGAAQGGSKTGPTVTSQTKGVDKSSIDYDRLHRDLQEIQDSLQTMCQPAVNTPPPGKTDSNNDTDIVPSTTTTPERGGRQLVWDYAADLGYRHGDLAQLEGMMSDATESSPLNPSNNLHYTSDGEETRTSGSSIKEHGEEEEHHDDSGNLTVTDHHTGRTVTSREMELEELISTFRNESRAIESRYQAIRSQGLADKVFGILTSSNPDQQAQGILSEVSAEEKHLRQAQLVAQVPTHSCSSSYSESYPSNSLPNFSLKGEDAVRKRLDLSTLSDSDTSHLQTSTLDASRKSYEGKQAGFAATSSAQTLIAAQMKKVADRTFNHSIELRSPVRQVIQCYPVYSHQRDQPQYQQLQQELQTQLQRQQQQQQRPQQQQSGQTPSQPREAWPEQQRQQGAVSTGDGGDRIPTPEEGAVSRSGDEKAGNQEKKSEDQGSPSSATSPAESDKSSEMRHGKYRPYRPSGSQDVYYTESDTASVADSVTTVESTHTGSDDAVGPYFPSSVLGSRHDQPGPSGTGIYSKHTKAILSVVGSSVDPPLPTIPEHSTPTDQQDRQSSEGSDHASATGSDGTRGSTNIKGSVSATGGADRATASERQGGEENPVTNVMVKRQARVEDILKERDAARRVGSVPSDPTREQLHSELLQRTKGEMLEAYRAQKSWRFSSPSGHQQSRIPVRGPSPDYQTAQRSKRQDQNPGQPKESGNQNVSGQPSIQEELQRSARQGTARDNPQPDAAEESEEARLLRMIDVQVEQEITEKQRQNSSVENNDTSPRQPESGPATAQTRRSPTDFVQHQREDRATASVSRVEDTSAKVPRSRDSSGKEGDAVQHRWEAEARVIITYAQQEVDEGVADERQEEAAIEHARRQRHQGARLQMLEREQEVEEAIADKRRKEAELEQRHHEVQMARDREVLEARKLAEARREADLRQEAQARVDAELWREEEARREMELRQEAIAKREAELQQEARARREAEMRRQAEEERAAKLRREAEARRQEEAKLAAQREEEAMRREVEMAREQALQGKLSKEARRQREAEEAIARAGGMASNGDVSNLALTSDGEADREVLERGYRILQQQEQEKFLDRQPVSHQAQLLREALEQEEAYRGQADLQILWERFIASFNTSAEDSTFGSDRLNGLADLLRDPTQHLVHTFFQQREAQQEENRLRAAVQREAMRQEARQLSESQRSSEEERAALERELQREEARQAQCRQSSEEESNGSYGEILQQRERDRLKRREIRIQKKKSGKSLSTSPFKTSLRPKQSSPVRAASGRDTLETLYSIPEDISPDMSPHKSRSPHKAHGGNQRRSDVIDPNLTKLRQRIHQQREKIGQERLKELRREQKLMKLKALLSAKQTGLLSDTAIAAHLATISSTSAPSSDSSAVAQTQDTLTASTFSNDTTTAKDSSTEMRLSKLAHSPPQKPRNQHTSHTRHGQDMSESLDDYTVMMEDSSIQTDSDLTQTNEIWNFRDIHTSSSRKRMSSSSQLSKRGGKAMKQHQMYSPYTRAEQPYSAKKMRTDRRPVTPWSWDADSRMRDASTMYPSSKQPVLGLRTRHRGGRMVSQGVQTSPQAVSPSRSGYPAIPVPLMTRGRGTHKRQKEPDAREVDQVIKGQTSHQNRYREAFDSSGVAACLSPDRERPQSSSPPIGRHKQRSPSSMRTRSPSPVELRLNAGTERKRMSPVRALRVRVSPSRGWGHSRDDDRENKPPSRQQQRRPPAQSGGFSWFIPLTESKPWRLPLKERQLHAAQEEWQSPARSQEKWRGLTRKELEVDREEETARFYLDKSAKELEEELGKQYDMFEEKPLCRMSLQEALLACRPDFVSHLRERQKRLQLSAENRKLQALVRAEQDRIFLDQRRVSNNVDQHPYNENLYHPKKRVITKQEMKELTEKKWKRLPEVKEKEILTRRSEEYRLNRLRAKVFNKRVQRKVLEKVMARARY